MHGICAQQIHNYYYYYYSDEANIGLITSGKVMNVGKSTSTKIIAEAMGVKESHPLSMVGGDGITSGTSL